MIFKGLAALTLELPPVQYECLRQ